MRNTSIVVFIAVASATAPSLADAKGSAPSSWSQFGELMEQQLAPRTPAPREEPTPAPVDTLPSKPAKLKATKPAATATKTAAPLPTNTARVVFTPTKVPATRLPTPTPTLEEPIAEPTLPEVEQELESTPTPTARSSGARRSQPQLSWEEMEEAPAKPAKAAAQSEELAATSVDKSVALSALGLEEGQIITSSQLEKYRRLMSPGLAWTISTGCPIEVTSNKPLPPPRAYVLATEKFSSQVKLGPGGNSLENYVAGLPFPRVDINDPTAVKKIMWNFYHNYYVIDDISLKRFHPRTGSIRSDGHLDVERAYFVDVYRKLNFTGRLYSHPRPSMPNPNGVRFKEGLHPIIEPFDLKGVGFVLYRYLDPGRQDDSWIYLPQLRRVRRLSSAQRSDALLGQDTDADSFYGYNGHIAWMDYSLLGEQIVLLPVHARHSPAKWQDPNDWAFEDAWEPRRVWVIEARSKFPQYAYAKRVLYVDQEAYLIPNSDSYDRSGQLWKIQFNLYAYNNRVTDQDSIAYPDKRIFQIAVMTLDAQLRHATSTAQPSNIGNPADTFILNGGEKQGVTEDFFSVAKMIASGK